MPKRLNQHYQMDQLTLIRKPIEDELAQYLAMFEQDFRHENPLLQLALQHILKRQGKRLRPILALLAARCFGRVGDEVLHASVSLELLHTASLVHDDIVDESNMRRGQASVNSLLSPQAAVLVGDYLLSKALQHSAKTQNIEVVQRISFIGEQLSDGELLQLYALDSDEISEKLYYDVIRRKTASLFATSAYLGAMLGSATEEQKEALRQYGEYLGIAFQIRDDMLDYTSTDAIGKPAGNDMCEGKLTLPAIYAINNSEDENIRQLALKVRRTEASKEEIAQLVSYTLEHGGLDYASSQMHRFVANAIEQLSVLPSSEFVNSLRIFAELVEKRNN